MSCLFLENVSRYADEESCGSAEADASFEAHFALCDEFDDYRVVGASLRSVELHIDPFAARRSLNAVIGSNGASFWRSRIGVPTRLLIALVLTLLGALFAVALTVARPQTTHSVEPLAPVASTSGFARFDRGLPPEIVVERRPREKGR